MSKWTEIAGDLGSGLGLLGGAAAFTAPRLEAERKKKEAQDRLAIIQKLGQVAVENKDGGAAAGFANQMPGLLKQGYNIDVPNQKLVGEPVMGRGMERPFIEQQGPPQMPGQKVGVLGAMSPTPYEYDTGARNLNNPRTLDQARKGLMLAAPTPEYKAYGADDDIYEMTPGGGMKLVRKGTPKPTPPAYFNLGPGETRYVQTPAGVKPVASVPGKPEHFVLSPGQTRYEVPTPGGQPRVVAAIAPRPPANTPENKEIAKRREAATIVGRAITKVFGGVAKVQPGTADIEIGGIYPMPPKQRRMLENAAIDMGGFLYEEPGKPPRIILNPGSTASGVASKLRDPALTWAANIDGSKTLVEKKAGVTSAAPPPKPVAPKAPPKWTPEMDSGARRDARQMVADENAGMVPSGPEGKRDVEDAYKLLKAQRMRDMGIQGEKTALERLIEMDEQKKKGGKK